MTLSYQELTGIVLLAWVAGASVGWFVGCVTCSPEETDD